MLLRLLAVATALVASATIHPAQPAPVPPPRESTHATTVSAPEPLTGVPAVPVAAVASAVTSAVTKAARRAAPSGQTSVQGGDVSWPNCPRTMGLPGLHGYALPMPVTGARFVIVGATNGPAFTRNPCLPAQLAWARSRHLPVAAYAVVHLPSSEELARYGGRGSLATRLGNAGIAETRQALAALRLAGMPRPALVWVDVETVGDRPWSDRLSANRALLDGVFTGYRNAHVRTGIYSYASAWKTITGSRRMPAIPTWVPSGSPHAADALDRCRKPSFSGGRVLIAQWSTAGRDLDLTCPGTAATLAAMFAHV